MKTVSLWNDHVPERDGVKSTINDVAISPDGGRAIVAVGNRVLLYNTENGDLIDSLRGHKETVYSVHYSFDGSRFASGGADNVVVIWKSTGQGMLKYNHTSAIQRVCYNPATLMLASCSELDFGLWTPEQKQVIKEKVSSKILSVAWTFDGSILAVGMQNGMISIRSNQAEEIQRIERRAPVWCLAFLPSIPVHSSTKPPGSPTAAENQETDLLIAGCWDKTVSTYRLMGQNHRLQHERRLKFYPCCITATGLAGSKINYLLVSGSNRGVSLYSREVKKLADLDESAKSWTWSCASHSLTEKVMVGCDDGDIDFRSLLVEPVNAIYRDRYAFRDNLTDILVHHLVSDKKVRIKCKEMVYRLSLFKNKLAVQFADKIWVYESNPDEPMDLHYRQRKERITTSVPCDHMVMTTKYIMFCSGMELHLYSFDGLRQRTWQLEAPVTYIKVDGGAEGREGVLVCLKNGVVQKIFVDNPFPLELTKKADFIICASLSLNRDKIATVDSKNILMVSMLKTQEVLFTADNVVSVCFNSEVDDIFCYTGESSMFVVSGIAPKSSAGSHQPEAQEQNLSGKAVEFSGQKIYCLNKGAISIVDVPQGNNILKLLDNNNIPGAYRVACLGATEAEWKMLGMRALRSNYLSVAKSAFSRLKEMKFLFLLELIDRAIPSAAPAAASASGRQGGEKRLSAARTSAFGVPMEVVRPALDPRWQAEVLAYEGHYNEAAKLHARAGMPDEAVRVLVDLKQWKEAKTVGQGAGMDISVLQAQEAKWLQETNDWKAAAELYASMGQHMVAVQLIAESYRNATVNPDSAPPSDGWQTCAMEIVRGVPKENAEVLSFCGDLFTEAAEDNLAKETFVKLGDITKLMNLYVRRQQWAEAAKLADEYSGQIDATVFLPYAEWLVKEDRYEEAISAFRKAGRSDLGRKLLEELTFNAIAESRFKDAGYYYWLLSKGELDANTDSAKLAEYEHKADLYYGYASVHSFVTDPFTSHLPESLFQVSRFIINSIGSSEIVPFGISKASTLYTLVRQSIKLGAYKLARQTLDRLTKLQLAPKRQDEIDHDMLMVQAKPVVDDPELLPVCFRCGSTNPLLNPFSNKIAKGDVCTNCGHPFVRSFINFGILPLVEFVPDPCITDEEAIEMIRQPPSEGGGRSRGDTDEGKWNEGRSGGADMMTFDDDDGRSEGKRGEDIEEIFTRSLNAALERQATSKTYSAVVIDASGLVAMNRAEVFVCRPSTKKKRATFYRNMLPDISVAISQPCHRFFHLEDFEFSYLSTRSCPYSRLKNVGEYGPL